MATSVTCTSARQLNGKIYINFGKEEMEFNGLPHLREFVSSQLSRDVLKAILIAKAMQTETPSAIVNKTITADLSLPANIVRIT